MKKTAWYRVPAVLAILMLLVPAGTVAASVAGYGQKEADFITTSSSVVYQAGNLTIVETAEADGNFTFLLSLLSNATPLNGTPLDEILNEDGPFTVFAPTDEAFERLPSDFRANLTTNPDRLAGILLYHVADGEYLAANLTVLDELETLQGENVTIEWDAVNGTLMIDDALVTVPDVACSNGVIHVIDQVIFPTGEGPGPGDGIEADFTAEPVTGDAPLLVNFTDMSAGENITLREWDFGDGGNATLQNPQHLYELPGNYTVSLTVTDEASGISDTEEKVGFITVTGDGEQPVDFVADVTEGPAPLTVRFRDNSTVAGIVSWIWDFGDDGVSNAQNPVHIYELPGVYNVSLMVTDRSGTIYTGEKEDYINVTGEGPGEPAADFTADVTDGAAPLIVTFTDLSTVENITAWFWDFGVENATSTAQNPVYTYVDAGVYTVSLTVTDAANATYTEEKENYINVGGEGAGVPAADFEADVTEGDAPLTVTFTDLSTVENITTWFWDFGVENATSTVQNPVYTYVDAGAYTVSLTVTDAANATYSEAKENYINVTGEGPGPVPGDIIATAEDAGTFTSLLAALDAANLTETLRGAGPFTVFAPTDDAFAALPEETFDLLLLDIDQLTSVLLYHVADGEYLAVDLEGLSSLATLQGGEVAINTTTGENETVILVDDAAVVDPDIAASNGVIHAIDAVLLPPAPEQVVVYDGAVLVSAEQNVTVDVIADNGTEPVDVRGDSPLAALALAAQDGNFTYALEDAAGVLQVTAIDDKSNDPVAFDPTNPFFDAWTLLVNGAPLADPVETYALAAGDDVVWFYGNADATPETGWYVVRIAIDTSEEPDATIDLVAGWNFISVPRRLAEGRNTAAIFDGVDTGGRSVFLYDPAGGWVVMTPETDVEVLEGIWIYSNGTATVPLFFEDDPLQAPPTRQLAAGWNAIGFSDLEAAPARDAMTSVADLWATLIGFDAATQSYEIAIQNGATGAYGDDRLLEPFRGYWVFMREDGELAAISA